MSPEEDDWISAIAACAATWLLIWLVPNWQPWAYAYLLYQVHRSRDAAMRKG